MTADATTDRPEDARLVAARERVWLAMKSYHEAWIHDEVRLEQVQRAKIAADCRLADLEREAAAAAVCALPCYETHRTGRPCGQWEKVCPTCTARRAREEAT